MKLVILIAVALVAVAVAAPPDVVSQIIRSSFDAQPNGPYVFGFETENGLKREEAGELKTVQDEDNKPREVLVTRGSFSYVDNEGKTHVISFVADEEGYKPVGEDIPVAPVARR